MRKTLETIATVGIMLVCAYLLGTTQARTETVIQTVTEIREVEKVVVIVPGGYLNNESGGFYDNYIDMRTVTGFDARDDGLQLYFDDDTGYYWEQ